MMARSRSASSACSMAARASGRTGAQPRPSSSWVLRVAERSVPSLRQRYREIPTTTASLGMAQASRGEARLEGSVAVLTGASSGIGRRLALTMADRGATVVGIARRGGLLTELEHQIRSRSGAFSSRVCDISDSEQFGRILHEIETEHRRVDIMVNNAGVESLTSADGATVGDYRSMFDVNFFAVVTGTLSVLPGMLARRSGIIVNVASDAARAPEPGHSAYAASKAAVAVFSESVALEVAGRGVRVHALYPAWVPTAMGLSGLQDGGGLPPRLVRRSEEQVADLVLRRMGGRRVDINASRLPLLAIGARVLFPVPYQWIMQRRGR